MTVASVLRASLLGVALLAGPGAWAADESQAFLKAAIQGNLAEIAAGKLAHEKGSSDAVKSYGQTLVDDHTKAMQDATAAAKTLGVTPPLAPTDLQKTMYDKLANEPGKTFDTDFVNQMLQDHQNAITNYEAAAAQDKDAAGRYASTTLPAIKRHMEQLTKLAKDMGI